MWISVKRVAEASGSGTGTIRPFRTRCRLGRSRAENASKRDELMDTTAAVARLSAWVEGPGSFPSGLKMSLALDQDSQTVADGAANVPCGSAYPVPSLT